MGSNFNNKCCYDVLLYHYLKIFFYRISNLSLRKTVGSSTLNSDVKQNAPQYCNQLKHTHPFVFTLAKTPPARVHCDRKEGQNKYRYRRLPGITTLLHNADIHCCCRRACENISTERNIQRKHHQESE